MHKPAQSRRRPADRERAFVLPRPILIVLAILFALGSGMGAWKVISETRASTDTIEKIFKIYSMKNEGAQTLHDFAKEHPVLNFFAGSTVKKALKLPSQGKSDEALYGEVPHLLKQVRHQSSSAAWWSWGLISLSLLYVLTVVAWERHVATRAVLFSLTAVSVVFFVIGVIAPVMVIWTAPEIPMSTGNLDFVIQYQVRGIFAIIWELLTAGHGIIGGFLLLFSIVTPLTKASLTFVATASHSPKLNYRIGQILHTIGKWSMADVFVAAILLALYALKFQQATRSIPCLGLYYFIGYCLLSLSTTQLLVFSGLDSASGIERREPILGLGAIGGLVLAVALFAAGSAYYTYQQYTVNTKEEIKREISVPSKLDARDLVLPGHRI